MSAAVPGTCVVSAAAAFGLLGWECMGVLLAEMDGDCEISDILLLGSQPSSSRSTNSDSFLMVMVVVGGGVAALEVGEIEGMAICTWARVAGCDGCCCFTGVELPPRTFCPCLKRW